MKKITAFSLAALLLLQNGPVLYALEAATVRSVKVSAESVYITTDRPVEYKTFSMDSPPRLVLELQNAKMRTLQEIPVNGPALRKVRTGQFKSEPVSVSRVVMELTQKTVHEITRKGAELIVMFGERPGRNAVKDAPAEKIKVIAPAAAGKPVEMVIEADVVKPADLARESAPVIAPKKRAAAAAGRSIMESLSKDPISFDYNEADVREVLDMMAAKAGVNIIYSDDVSGTLTLSLTKVPFDEAFKTIISVKSLAVQQVGDNILRIASPKTFISEQKYAMLQTRVFFLNYSKAAEMKVQVDAVVLAEARGTGKTSPDDANNALIVTDTSAGLEATARLIRSLDRAPRQVLIEVKLIEVSLVDEFDLGVNWGYASGPDAKGRFVGTTNSLADIRSAGVGTNFPNSASAGTGVDLVAKNVYGGFRLGKITSTSFLDLAITAAAKKGKAKVLSDPKVATLNNKEANINITSQIPYETTEITNSASGSVSTKKVTYVTTGIVLKVTPSITSDGRISMKVNPSVSQPSATAGTTAPSVDTRSADTNVVVNNGETIVIGGLIHDTQSDTVTKVPLLGDIPLLGALFRKKSVARNRLELLIFVTPKIIED
ncbi:MAG: hypothetical protein A2234_09800 [Elusimicrobia bacterium RIFOXYA2_FULL_58_8]|nr:MAG: hypothetical protein A2285_05250 [Elusimicrobia bacterium RIFOXYA12_FULL_57_11]OGS14082.1 MAG: hypothetical protein A2234_09800 [Elusimicrobia bacterium RIFOXYA2_FULL_58_8]